MRYQAIEFLEFGHLGHEASQFGYWDIGFTTITGFRRRWRGTWRLLTFSNLGIGIFDPPVQGPKKSVIYFIQCYIFDFISFSV